MINGKSFETFLENPTEYEKFCMKYYRRVDIESMFSEVAKFHNFFQKRPIEEKEPFFQLVVENFNALVNKLKQSYITLEKDKFDTNKYFSFIEEEILNLYYSITGEKDTKIEEINIDILTAIKSKYLKYILSKYKIDTFDINKFDFSVYNSTNIISEDDLFFARKIILFESFLNILNQKEIFNSILNNIEKIKDKIPEILSLPETITHNDVHPLNFLSGEDGKVFLVDFDRGGKNKRVCDLGLTFTTNNIEDEDVLYSIISGYRKNNFISHKELNLVYDFYILSYLTSIVREIEELRATNFRIAKHIFEPKKWMTKIQKFEKMSEENNLPRVLDDIVETGLDALDLATDKTKTFQTRILKLREECKQKSKEI